jgi:hypothetical protein
MRDHGVASSPWVLGIAEWVVLWCWLREPHITTISSKVTGLERISNILLDDDGSTSSVDKL